MLLCMIKYLDIDCSHITDNIGISNGFNTLFFFCWNTFETRVTTFLQVDVSDIPDDVSDAPDFIFNDISTKFVRKSCLHCV